MKKHARYTLPKIPQPYMYKVQAKTPEPFKPSSKFWGIWLPVPTIIALLNSLFWTWFLLRTVGYTAEPIEKSAKKILEIF